MNYDLMDRVILHLYDRTVNGENRIKHCTQFTVIRNVCDKFMPRGRISQKSSGDYKPLNYDLQFANELYKQSGSSLFTFLTSRSCIYGQDSQ
jgi:hypothetical protein